MRERERREIEGGLLGERYPSNGPGEAKGDKQEGVELQLTKSAGAALRRAWNRERKPHRRRIRKQVRRARDDGQVLARAPCSAMGACRFAYMATTYPIGALVGASMRCTGGGKGECLFCLIFFFAAGRRAPHFISHAVLVCSANQNSICSLAAFHTAWEYRCFCKSRSDQSCVDKPLLICRGHLDSQSGPTPIPCSATQKHRTHTRVRLCISDTDCL